MAGTGIITSYKSKRKKDKRKKKKKIVVRREKKRKKKKKKKKEKTKDIPSKLDISYFNCDASPVVLKILVQTPAGKVASSLPLNEPLR